MFLFLPLVLLPVVKVRVKLWNLTDLVFDLDPNWGSTPNVETLYIVSCLPDTKKKQKIFRAMSQKMSISLSFLWRCLPVHAEQNHFLISITFYMGLMQNEVVWKVLPIFGDYITELKKANNFAKIIPLLGMFSLSAIFGIPVVSHITWPKYLVHIACCIRIVYCHS